ncbi:hypothetical protein SAV31267_093800 [Streptomyces avermitilis]|nr:hypothetical protein SAV31267_093800 [Streptomyces avermitilis]
MTPERQAFRERIRMEAAERFGAGASNAEVAKDLRMSVRSFSGGAGAGRTRGRTVFGRRGRCRCPS